MRSRAHRAALIAASAPSGAVAGDPLAALSDDFDGDTLDPKWTLYQGDGVATLTVADGELGFEIDEGSAGGSFWYANEQGCLLWQAVTGDFECVATLRIRNAADTDAPPVADYRLVGIAAHDPDRSTDLDYVHVALGAMHEADLRAEHKSTEASVTEPGGGTSPGYSSISWPSGEGQIRLRRVGQVFTCSVRALEGDPWTEVRVVDRAAAPLPDTVHVGPMVYSANATPDIRGFYAAIEFSTP